MPSGSSAKSRELVTAQNSSCEDQDINHERLHDHHQSAHTQFSVMEEDNHSFMCELVDRCTQSKWERFPSLSTLP